MSLICPYCYTNNDSDCAKWTNAGNLICEKCERVYTTYDSERAKRTMNTIRKHSKRIWINGCFDILHKGHLDLLKHAASLGTVFVGIDSDSRVKKMKGEDRPINDEDFRSRLLSSLKFVQKVFVFSTDEQLEKYINLVNPDYMVIGEDYKDKRVIGGEGRNIIFFPHTKGYSTTKTIEKIKE